MDTEDKAEKWQAQRRLHKHQTLLLWQGVLNANIMAAVLYLLMAGTNYLLRGVSASSGSGVNDILLPVWVISTFTGIPIAMGIVCMRSWHELKLRAGQAYVYSLGVLGRTCLLAAIVFHEGVICLVMALPLIALMMLIGIYFGHLIMQARDNRLRVSLLPLLALMVIAGAAAPHQFADAVTDVVTINAPAAHVWTLLASYPAMRDAPDYALWRMGLPYPVQSTADGAYVGAQRRCIFTDNVVIGERITKAVPLKTLAFDITRQPDNPEILGHFILKSGEFSLRDNGNRTCTLTGTSWYVLNVYPSWYFNLWARDIVRHVHLRVMHHIATLAENG